jgi:hypothetical protein
MTEKLVFHIKGRAYVNVLINPIAGRYKKCIFESYSYIVFYCP